LGGGKTFGPKKGESSYQRGFKKHAQGPSHGTQVRDVKRFWRERYGKRKVKASKEKKKKRTKKKNENNKGGQLGDVTNGKKDGGVPGIAPCRRKKRPWGRKKEQRNRRKKI